MKWVDYRDKLGIGFSDKRKAKLLSSKVAISIGHGALNENYSRNDYYRFCLMTGMKYNYCLVPTSDLVALFTENELSIPQIISYYIAFVNTQSDSDENHRALAIEVLEEFLDDISIPYSVIKDDDGYFIFPKGAKELDDALVSETFTWLEAYPKAYSAFAKALRDYSEATESTASDVADKFRKALEAFFQEFFDGRSSIENYKSAYGKYLKSHGVPADISGNFETLLQFYANFMNNYAKHHDKTRLIVLEYIMYQTGNIIRLLITLKQEEFHHAD